jgi:UDP-glucose 4-epimerase
VNQGHEVTLLDDLSGGYIDNLVTGAEFVQGRIDVVALIEGVFEERKFEYVLYLAAYAAEGLSHFIKRFNY